MEFADWIDKNHKSDRFKYVGTIYGDVEQIMTGQEISAMLREFGDTSPYIDHPAIGGRSGFYIESGDIMNEDRGQQELVFESYS